MHGEIAETNPNRCGSCEKRNMTVGDWCTVYTFQPTNPCLVHSISFERSRANRLLHGIAILEKMDRFDTPINFPLTEYDLRPRKPDSYS